jgi:hypothetical protein
MSRIFLIDHQVTHLLSPILSKNGDFQKMAAKAQIDIAI